MFRGRINLTREQRELVKDTFDNTCAHCPKDTRLMIHHLDGNPNNNEIENLILLCDECHSDQHPHNEEGIKSFYD